MFKKRATHISNPINEFLRQAGLETPLLQRRIIAAWRDVAGEFVAGKTGEIFIKNQTMWVKLNSPALRQELAMHSSRLTQLLNEKVCSQVITGLKFY